MRKHDADVARLTLAGKTRQEIADELGITPDSVSHSRKRTGTKNQAPFEARGGRPPSYSPEDRERVLELTRANATAKEIENRTGVSEHVVYKIRQSAGLVAPHPSKSLAPIAERIEEAREMVEDGAPFSEIKRTLHLSRGVLQREFPGQAWSREQCVDIAVAVRQANRQIRKNGLDIHSVGL